MKLNNNLSLDSIKLPLGQFPVLYKDSFFIDCLEQMTKFKIGTACVVDENLKLLGVITDGDIRRNLISSQKMFSNLAVEYCNTFKNDNSKFVKIHDSIDKVINIHITEKIWDLPIVDNDNKLLGLIHLNNVLKEIF